MPYLNPEETKQIRSALKQELPEFKLSVVTRHYMSLDITVLKGPVDFGSTHIQVNHFWYDRDFETNPEAVEFFKRLFKAINSVKPQVTVSEDGDYGSIPNYYLDVSIGRWNKPYEVTK